MIGYKIKAMDNKTGEVRYLMDELDGRKHYIADSKRDAKFALKTARYNLWDEDNIYGTNGIMYSPIYNRKFSRKDMENTWSIDTVWIKDNKH